MCLVTTWCAQYRIIGVAGALPAPPTTSQRSLTASRHGRPRGAEVHDTKGPQRIEGDKLCRIILKFAEKFLLPRQETTLSPHVDLP